MQTYKTILTVWSFKLELSSIHVIVLHQMIQPIHSSIARCRNFEGFIFFTVFCTDIISCMKWRD